MVEYYLHLAALVGCRADSPRLELHTTSEEERSARAVWRRLGIRSDGRVIAFNCAAAYGSSKLWPNDRFAMLARRLASERDYDILIMCGPSECHIATAIVRLARHPNVHCMADQPLDLGTAKACIRQCRVMVSTDSGPRHIAAALHKPVVTLFGPMLPTWSYNPTQKAVNLISDAACIGCGRRACPLPEHPCMRDLTVEMVYDAVLSFLEPRPSVIEREHGSGNCAQAGISR